MTGDGNEDSGEREAGSYYQRVNVWETVTDYKSNHLG